MTTLDPPRVVEAALFSAGKPLLESEISEATGLGAKEVTAALKVLSKEYAERDTALEVAKGGAKWAMQVRGRYSERARKLARMEIPAKVLKTLALIAFHQPIKQSELKDMVGSVVYDHVRELHERGMIAARQDGITKILTTSPRFPEYFGLDATDREALKGILAERVGIDPQRLRREVTGPQTTLEDSTPTAAHAADETRTDDSAETPAEQPEDGDGAEALKATTG